MSYNLNGCDKLKFFTAFRENGLGISMSWYIASISGFIFSEVWIHWQNHSFNSGSDLLEQSFEITDSPRSCKYFFTFCHIHSVQVAFILTFLSFWSQTPKTKSRWKVIVVVTGRLTLKTSYTSSVCRLTRMSELSRFVYILCHVTLHVKSNAEKVNSST